ncbi:MAG: hypothetical protein V2B20_03595 [Pseudomonadota bacterium]
MNQPPILKSFVKAGDKAAIVCPQCNCGKVVGIQRFQKRLHLLNVKCRCGYFFKVELEFRRHYRKQTDLSGIYQPLPPAIGGGKVRIFNLSLSGACFDMHGIHDLEIGQKGVLIFTLDNRKTTTLTKSVFIKCIIDNRIGSEFEADRAFEKELGFYLLP